MAEMSTRNNTIGSSENSTRSTTGWDRETEHTPVFAVVSAVADAADADMLELPPLHEAIDAEALNDLFLSGPPAAVDEVSFQYAGYDVAVCGDGTVEVQPVHRA